MTQDASSGLAQIMGPFQKNVRRLLRERKMSQAKLAGLVGVPKTTLGNWLTGVARPPIEAVVQIADQLGVSLDQLFGRMPPGGDQLLRLHDQATGLAGAIEWLLSGGLVTRSSDSTAKRDNRVARGKTLKSRRKDKRGKAAK